MRRKRLGGRDLGTGPWGQNQQGQKQRKPPQDTTAIAFHGFSFPLVQSNSAPGLRWSFLLAGWRLAASMLAVASALKRKSRLFSIANRYRCTSRWKRANASARMWSGFTT